MTLQFPYNFGWNNFFQSQIQNLEALQFEIGRIAAENKTNYIVWSNSGEKVGEVVGKLQYNVSSTSELPKVGDWVLMTTFEDEQKAIIHEVLERQTKFSRKVAGKSVEEQIIAANLTKLFIVTGLDHNFNLSRIQRYYAQAEQDGIETFFVLTKADLNHNPEDITELQSLFGNERVIVTSTVTHQGFDELERCLKVGETIAFVGSSGVGKSTLINLLIGEHIQKIGAVRALDSKGRHTTTRREMFLMKSGAILIDTPGMREFHLWKTTEDNSNFHYLESFAEDCRFRDCTHVHEAGCAVLEAVKNELLPERIYNGYLKLKKELEFIEGKDDIHYQLKKKNDWKKIHKSMRNFKK